MKDKSASPTRILRPEQYQAAKWTQLGVDTPLPMESECREPDQPEQPEPPLMTAAELDEIRRQAHQEGHEQGHKEGFEYGHNEGLEEGRKDIQSRLARLDEILAKLEAPFEDLDDQVEREVVTLVVSMVRQLVRREVKTDAGQIVGVVREALGVLPVSARRIRVLLHPEDAELVREAYSLGDTDQKWQIIEDPVIARGGCRVYTENSQIDATLESRLNSLIAPLLASERGGDAEEEAGADANVEPGDTRQPAAQAQPAPEPAAGTPPGDDPAGSRTEQGGEVMDTQTQTESAPDDDAQSAQPTDPVDENTVAEVAGTQAAGLAPSDDGLDPGPGVNPGVEQEPSADERT